MDLVGRLKEFLSVNNIPVTQFADSCNIPRPTVSQIINGRNKKISDEIISKIHLTYPSLSVYWLMFGEGNMINSDVDTSKEKSTVSEPDDSNDKLYRSEANIFSLPTEEKEILKSKEDKNQLKLLESIDSQKNSKNISISTNSGRTISRIVVFYNDNSFESFGPSLTL